ncbi:FAD/FMN-dependent dehydrogenase [Desulfitobacterium dichloroeliminans LMG P-21439]|uniref:FAD/FMN-dependent dehydrogenase n=1 Tax=Desulfitobacterium dichloroeliminans (strain LMG P-21439 / DCA1) TaxID=871963 RepID=L0FBQ3_DESDL|nr:FAD-linked oxidase C-terminal domain-containing protein [Desulfitobacterium dichloroeliminans]AGA70642.1 FAD/FMN-dependent dehydrogenase [Desulfitobacterium dichloroeliminans LMG P-21439]
MLKAEALNELIQVLGKEHVITEHEELLTYSYDATAAMPRQTPDVFITPQTTEQVSEVMKISAKYNLPVYPRGSATNLSGGTIPIEKGIVMSMLHMNKILEVDDENLTASVQPGVIIADLNNAAMEHGLFYPPDPGTVNTATMGGSVSESSGGLRGLKYGVTKHYVMGMKLVRANGDIIKWGGKTVKNVTGYDLTALFTGAEGTLGIITEILVKLNPVPESRKALLGVFDDIDKAGNAISAIIRNKVIPATLEIMDNITIRTVENFTHAGLPVDAEAILLCEVDGYIEAVEREAALVEKILKEQGAIEVNIAKTDEERDKIWFARRQALPALAQRRPTTVLEDATVPRSKIPHMIKEIRRIADKYDLLIGTFGHAGDGNLHPTILTDENNKEEMERVEKAVEEIFQVAVSFGGTLSGEHGIGMAKAKFLPLEFGEAGVKLLRDIKEACDPDYRINPGKMVRRD